MSESSRSSAASRIAPWIVALATIAVACGGQNDGRPNIVLITIDTLRADRLGIYGAENNPTPHIDGLAREGVVFDRATAPIPLTKPSHFSLFTSLYPRDHGVVNNQMSLGEDVPTLAEVLAEHGYDTAAFTAAAILDEASGSGRGFAFFEASGRSSRDANLVAPRAIEWLRTRLSPRPFLLWVHMFDPHMPYAPPPEYRPAGPPGMEQELPVADWPAVAKVASRHDGDLPAAAYERMVGLYDGEVRHVDYWIGELLETLERRKWSDRTVVVFTADHGECFENGVFFYHSNCLYDPAVLVPLIVRYPPQVPAGERRPEVVENLDVAPTLLALSGAPVPEGFLGRDLFAPGVEEGQAFLQHPLYPNRNVEVRGRKLSEMKSVMGEPAKPLIADVEQTALRTRRWKLVQTGDLVELYDLESDPGERRNVAGERPEVARELRARLERWAEEHPLQVASSEALNDELIEHLRALGYVQ